MSDDRARLPDPIDLRVGTWIMRYRQLAGLSQTELGAALGISAQQVRAHERGADRVSASRLFAVAETLDVPVTAFFESDPPGGPGGAVGQLAASARQSAELVTAFDAISKDAVRRQVLALVRSIARSDGSDHR